MYIADCKDAFAALGPRLAQIYGQGESPMTITAMHRALLADAIAARRRRSSRIGGHRADRHRGHRSPTRTTTTLPSGETGEVLVRGATVMRATGRIRRRPRQRLRDGWLHTGDVGVLDEDGFLTLKDRSKDLIISGGTNIYPREVEEVLLTHPDVAEAAVVGRAHAGMGRGSRRLRRRARRNRCRRRANRAGARARRAVPRPDRALQAAEGLRVPRRVAEEQCRQGAEDGVARARRGIRLSVASTPGRAGPASGGRKLPGVSRQRGRRRAPASP